MDVKLGHGNGNVKEPLGAVIQRLNPLVITSVLRMVWGPKSLAEQRTKY